MSRYPYLVEAPDIVPMSAKCDRVPSFWSKQSQRVIAALGQVAVGQRLYPRRFDFPCNLLQQWPHLLLS